jgi:hypothetical protein
MSLQVTAALGAVMAALITAFLSHSGSLGGAGQSTGAGESTLLNPEALAFFILTLLFLYALVQTLITANYIYHTFQIHILGVTFDQLAPAVIGAVEEGIKQMQTGDKTPTSRWLKTGWLFVRSCQPLIPAVSALLGWPAFFYFLFVMECTPPNWPSCFMASAGVVILLIILLSRLHKQMEELAIYEIRDGIRRRNARVSGPTHETSAIEADSP